MLGTKRLFITIILLVALFNCTAQKLTITGKVVDKDGEPAPFVTIKIKGTNTGALTDVDGKFSISASKRSITLLCSAVGYLAIEKKLSEKDFTDSSVSINITMLPDTHLLKEVLLDADTKKEESVYSYNAGTVSTPPLASPATGLYKTEGKAKFSSVAGKPRSSLGYMSVRSEGTVYRAEGTYKRNARAKAVADSLPVPKNNRSLKRTSLLTAGEVNDFKKWTMWEDYNETDFKKYSDKWNLYAIQRYSVQLQNNDHKAIVGETVYLVNKDTKEIIWTAVSDNTGKAELWNGFSDDSKEQNLVIEIRNEKTQFGAVPFSQGINHIQLSRSCAVSNKVEISFVVDATGSMGDEIEYLKDELQDILAKIAVKNPSLDMYTSAVFYKDKGDDYITRHQAFTKGTDNTIDFIKKQNAGGGGDYPEALKEALDDAVNNLEWSETARTKIIFLLMDAPPHDEAKKDIAVLIAKAAAKGIRIVPVACSGTDKATEFIMRSMALATNGTYLFLTDDSGIGNSHIKPTTDEFKVELLNDLLQRVIEQMCFVNACESQKKNNEPSSVYSNAEKVKVFPNPTKGPVTVETDKELNAIFVADFTGKILMRLQVKEVKKQYKLDLSNFPSATYFIRYTTNENKAGAEKLVLIQ